jgi:hypothetical protein
MNALKEHTRAFLLLIGWYFPDIVTEFHGKQFSFPWRRSRDGLRSGTFTAAATGTRQLRTIVDPESCMEASSRNAAPILSIPLFAVRNPRKDLAQGFQLQSGRKDQRMCHDNSP